MVYFCEEVIRVIFFLQLKRGENRDLYDPINEIHDQQKYFAVSMDSTETHNYYYKNHVLNFREIDGARMLQNKDSTTVLYITYFTLETKKGKMLIR